MPPRSRKDHPLSLATLRLGLFRALLLCFVVPSLAFSETGSGPDGWLPAENLSPGPMPARSAQLAYDPASGDLHAVWVEGQSGQEEILGRRWSASSQSWTSTKNLSNFSWQDEGPALSFDEEGQGHLLWTRRYARALGAAEEGTDLVWRRWDGAAWSTEQVLLHVDAYLPGAYGLILTEIPDATLLFVVWPGGFREAEYRDGSWSELTLWDFHLDVTLAQILVDGEGTWHAAAFGPNDNIFAPWYYDAYYLSYDGATWSGPVNLTTTDGTAYDVGMAFDALGRLHYLWSDPFSPLSESLKSAIWERVYDGSSWTASAEVTADDEDQAINGFSLTSDASGTLHLAWSQGLLVDYVHTDLGIYYRTGDGNTWGPEQVVYTSTAESRYPVLAVGGGNTSLIWQEGPSSERDVFFSGRAGAPSGPVRSYLPLVSR
jgi:hypothetical protein